MREIGIHTIFEMLLMPEEKIFYTFECRSEKLKR